MTTLNLMKTAAPAPSNPHTAPRLVPRVKTVELFAECLVCGADSDTALCEGCGVDIHATQERVRTVRAATDEDVRAIHANFVIPEALSTWWAKVEEARMGGDPRFEAAWSAALAGGGERARLCRAWVQFERACTVVIAMRERLNKADHAISALWLDRPMEDVEIEQVCKKGSGDTPALLFKGEPRTYWRQEVKLECKSSLARLRRICSERGCDYTKTVEALR